MFVYDKMAQGEYYSNKCQESFSFGQSHDDIASPDGMNNLGSMIEHDWQKTQSYDVRSHEWQTTQSYDQKSEICGNLNLKSTDPESWDIDDVQVWLRWVSTSLLKMEHSDIPPVCMDGRNLCSCTKEAFREMLQVPAPVAAKIYEIFQAWYHGDFNTFKLCTSGGGLWDTETMLVQEPVISTTMHYQPPVGTYHHSAYQSQFDNQVISHAPVDNEPWLTPVAPPDGYHFAPTQAAPYDRPQDFGRPLPMCHYYPMAATYPSSVGGCQTVPCDSGVVSGDPDKQPKKRRGPGRPKLIRPPKTKKLQLFEFLLQYLENPRSPHLEWIDKSTGLFRFQSGHKEDFANKWGDYKGNRNMTYQNLARALRNYCHSNIKIMLNEKRKLHYRFNIDAILEHPTKFKLIFCPHAKHMRKS